MQTSYGVRIVAEKLFWSLEDVWYCISEYHLQKKGEPMSYLRCCPVAARQVRQVVIECDSLTTWIAADGSSRQYDMGRDTELAQAFWNTFQKCFPLANRVVLNRSYCQTYPLLPEAPELKRVCDGVLALKSTCPPNIRSSLYLAYLHGRYVRGLALVALHENGTSAAIEQSTAQHVKLPPVTRPFGAFRNHQDFRQLVDIQMMSTRPRSRLPTHPGDVVPPASKASLQEHADKFNRLENEIRASFRLDHKAAWGEPGSEERRRFTAAYLAQLVEDPLFQHEDDPIQSSEWTKFKEIMDEDCI
jgi:hypothetical protein